LKYWDRKWYSLNKVTAWGDVHAKFKSKCQGYMSKSLETTNLKKKLLQIKKNRASPNFFFHFVAVSYFLQIVLEMGTYVVITRDVGVFY
jgi:hypothetical protein